MTSALLVLQIQTSERRKRIKYIRGDNGVIDMTKVTLSTKYCLSPESVKVLVDSGLDKSTMWWMRNLTEDRFIDYGPRIPATEPFVVELDLPDGEYQFGCGKYNIKNEFGEPCSQKVTLYIEDGKIRYCKWRELPSQGGTKSSGGITSKVDYGDSAPSKGIDWTSSSNSLPNPTNDENVPVVLMEDYYYCNKFGFVLPKDEVPSDDYCFESNSKGSKFNAEPTVACRNCVNVRRLYRTDEN